MIRRIPSACGGVDRDPESWQPGHRGGLLAVSGGLAGGYILRAKLCVFFGGVLMQRGPATEDQKSRMPQLYKKGQSGNPRGTSSLTMLRTHENARKAVALRERLLDTLHSRIATIEVMTTREFADEPERIDEQIQIRVLRLLTPDVNRLITDAENRGLGAPRQSVDIDAVVSADRRRPEDFSDEELSRIVEGDYEELSYEETRQIGDRFLSQPLPLGDDDK